MASETVAEPESATAMEFENPPAGVNPVVEKGEALNGDANSKREREVEEEEGEQNGVAKKQKLDEKRESVDADADAEVEQDEGKTGPVCLGPKRFESAVEMFDYFYKFLHHWPMNVCVNKYEYMVLLDLIKKGHPEPDKKIGSGVGAFEIRQHPMWKSRCFFVVRTDKSVEDFSFRKCVDHILPLPENLKTIKSNENRGSTGAGGGRKGGGGGGRKGGSGGRGGRGRGHGRGRGGKSRR